MADLEAGTDRRAVVGFAGQTHLGLISAVATAAQGFDVVGYDADSTRIDALSEGRPDVEEPGLVDLMAANKERLRFSSEIGRLVACDLVYIATDVPTDDSGASDLSGVSKLIGMVDAAMKPGAVLVVLCQVPPGFTRGLDLPSGRPLGYQVETLVFGRAVERATEPERFIIGRAVAGPLGDGDPLPWPWRQVLESYGCPILAMGYESAELCKIAINAMLVAHVSAANTLAGLAEQIGADWLEIVPALRLDARIGQKAYIAPGLGISGGNLERDLATIRLLGDKSGADTSVVAAWQGLSALRKGWPLEIARREVLAEMDAPRFALWGLAYKENTHSTKNSPALAFLDGLREYEVCAYDPVVQAESAWHPKLTQASDPLTALTGADALAILTPWPEFRDIDPEDLVGRLAGRTVIDPYGFFEGESLAALGFDHYRLGRPPRRGASPDLTDLS